MRSTAPRIPARAQLHSRLDESELEREEVGGILRDSLPVPSLGERESLFLRTVCSSHPDHGLDFVAMLCVPSVL